MIVERVADLGATVDSRACLHVRGNMPENWNYALSETVPLQAGRLYRLSAWVKVTSAGSKTPMPFLKCEYMAADRNREMGRAVTDAYDAARLGQWQHLTGEFRAPAGTVACWLALEKGTSDPTQIDAYLDNVILEPIEQLTALSMYDLNPLPPTLEKVRNTHPRLYLNAARVAELRGAIRTTHADLWVEVRTLANRAVRRGAPAYRRSDAQSGDEQLWQREVGNTMPYLAMAYLMTDDKAYLDAAKQWALTSCGYPTWGYGSYDGKDLVTGHQLFGLAIIYDWCYHDLDEASRQRIRETLINRASAMFQAAATSNTYWYHSYLQNHLWVNVCGLGAAGFALFDEAQEARRWIGLASDKFRRTMEALGQDGASHEGVGYWEYGAEYMLKFMHLAKDLLGVDLYESVLKARSTRFESMDHQVNHRQFNHGFTTDRQRLIVFAQSPVLAQPRKGPFDHPPAGQDRKTFNVFTAFDNLQHPMTEISRPLDELACISTVCPDQRQAGETTRQFLQDQFSPVAVLDAGCVHHHCHHQTECINHQMAFSARYLLASVITSVPPFEAVLMDWLSIIAALGLGCRPAWTRTCSWSA